MDKKTKLAIGSDKAGYELKEHIGAYLREKGYAVEDVGCHNGESGLYAVAAKAVADRVRTGECEKGILICGTGQGMVMAANKFPSIRAALVYDILPAVLSREHNNSNVLCTGAWLISKEMMEKVVDVWLFANYNQLYDEGLELLEEYRKGD